MNTNDHDVRQSVKRATQMTSELRQPASSQPERAFLTEAGRGLASEAHLEGQAGSHRKGGAGRLAQVYIGERDTEEQRREAWECWQGED